MALKKAHFRGRDFNASLLCFCFTPADQAAARGSICSVLKVDADLYLLGNLLPKRVPAPPLARDLEV